MMATLGWSFLGLSATGLLALVGMRTSANRRTREVRQRLQTDLQPVSFDLQELSDLPAPAQRYLRRALPEGKPLARMVEVEIDELVKFDKTVPDSPFQRFLVSEILCVGRGMSGEGSTIGQKLSQRSSFWYMQGLGGERREALLDLVPLRLATGPDVSRMLCSRALYDFIWLPTAFLPSAGAVWEPIDDERAEVRVSLDGEMLALRLTVNPEGYLREAFALRWGSTGTENHRFQPIPYGMIVDRSQTVDGYTLPVEMRGGWWYGTDRYIESIVMKIGDARFLAHAIQL